MMEKTIIINFLKSFFSLFNANLEKYEFSKDKILGSLVWCDEDSKQEFSYEFNSDFSLLSKTKLLCDFLKKFNLVDGDHIVISEAELISLLIANEWNEAECIKAINSLCDLQVKMIDFGEETDSFYVHF